MTGWPTITDHIDWQSHSFCQNFVAANKERCAALGLTPAIPDVVSGTIVGNHAFWAALQQWCLNNCGNFVPRIHPDVRGIADNTACHVNPGLRAGYALVCLVDCKADRIGFVLHFYCRLPFAAHVAPDRAGHIDKELHCAVAAGRRLHGCREALHT